MLTSISLMHIACRQGVTNGRKQLNWNNIKKLHCLAAFKDIKSSNLTVQRTQSPSVLDKATSHLFKYSTPLLLDVPHRKKGHSHWQNIQHSKAIADTQKHKKISQFQNLMKGAISAGGPNPETNAKLNRILENMRTSGLPKADIKRYLDNATRRAASSSVVYFEARGPRGSMFVLEIETENAKIARMQLNTLMKKTLGQVSDYPTFQNFFDMKGTVEVPIAKDMQTSNMDEYLEIAIESGAEDVILTKSDENDDNSEMVLKFHCDPKTLTAVTKEIEDTYNLEISSSKVVLYPHTWVTIDSEQDIEACRKVVEKMQSHPEFVTLFDNITVPEE